MTTATCVIGKQRSEIVPVADLFVLGQAQIRENFLHTIWLQRVDEGGSRFCFCKHKMSLLAVEVRSIQM